MALQTIKGGLWVPTPADYANNGISFSNLTAMTANTHKWAVVFQVPKTGSIHKVHVRYGTVTSGVSTRMQADIETVGAANGDPSGTLYGGCTAGNSSIRPVSNTWDAITLGTDATATQGDFVAAVISFGSGGTLFNAGDSIAISTLGSTSEISGFPYLDNFVTGAWAKSTRSPVFAIEYSDGTFDYIPSVPVTTITTTSYNSSSSPNEIGNRYTLPFPGRIRGVCGNFNFTVANQTSSIVIYGSGGTSASVTLTPNQEFTAGGGSVNFYTFLFPSTYVFAANETVRVTLKATNATNNIAVERHTYNAAALQDQEEGGQLIYLTQWNGTGWADDTTQRASISILIDQLDDGTAVGGGGGVIGSRIFTGF